MGEAGIVWVIGGRPCLALACADLLSASGWGGFVMAVWIEERLGWDLVASSEGRAWCESCGQEGLGRRDSI